MADKLIIEVDLVKGDTSGAFKKGVQKDAAKAGVVAGRTFGKGFSQAASSQIGASLSFAAIAATLTRATRSAAEFQKEFTAINTLLPKTQKLTSQNADAIKDLAAQFGTNAAAQAKSYYQVVSAGTVDAAKATKLLTVANKLAVGGIASVEGSIDILTTAVNAYQESNLNAADAADSLFTAVRLGKTTVSELSASLGIVLTPAQQAGAKFDEVSAAIAQFTKRGVNTVRATTQLNALFSSFTKNISKLGPDFSQASIQTNGLAATLKKLQERTGGSSKKLQVLLADARAVRGAQVLLADSGREYAKVLEEFGSKAGATGKAFREVAETDAFKLTKALNSISLSLENLGTNILPTVASGFATLAGFIDDITFAGFAKESKTALQEVDTKLGSLIDKQQMLQNATQDETFRLISPERKAEIFKDLEDVESKITKLQKVRANFLNQPTEKGVSKPAETDSSSEDVAIQKSITNAQLFAQAKIQSIQQIRDAENARLEALVELRNRELVTDQEFAIAQQQIYAESATQRAMVEAKASQSISDSFIAQSKAIKGSVNDTAKALNNLAVNGYGRAFKEIGRALAKGEDVNQAFVDSVKATAGEAASAIADYYILEGAGRLAKSYGSDATGYKMIAVGGGLKILAGALGASGSGTSVGSGSGGDSGGGVSQDNPRVAEAEDRERSDPQSQFVVNVQGDIFDTDATGTRLAEIFSEAGAKQGILVTDTKFA